MKCRKKFLNKERTITSDLYDKIYAEVQSEEADTIYRDRVMKIWKKTVGEKSASKKYSEVSYFSFEEAQAKIAENQDLRPEYLGIRGNVYTVKYTNPAVPIRDISMKSKLFGYGELIEEFFIENNNQLGIWDSRNFQIDPDDKNMLEAQLSHIANPSKTQKEAAEKLLTKQNLIEELDSTEQYYITKDGDKLLRTTSRMQETPGFEKTMTAEQEEQFAPQREMGNQFDDAAQEVILNLDKWRTQYGKHKEPHPDQLNQMIRNIKKRAMTRGESIRFNDNALRIYLSRFSQYLANNYANNVILTQQVLYNVKTKTAGSADIIAIDKNGLISIIDIKTSINPINFKNGAFQPYTKLELDGSGNIIESSYTNRYNQDFGDRPSKQKRHSAQLSIYMGMAEAMGFNMNLQDPIRIFPVHATQVQNGVIQFINFDDQPIAANILKEFREAHMEDNEISDTVYKQYKNIFAEKYEDLLKAISNEITALERDSSTASKIQLAKNKEWLRQLKEGKDTIDAVSTINNYITNLERMLKGEVIETKEGKKFYKSGIAQELFRKLKSGEESPEVVLQQAILVRDRILAHKDLAEDLANILEDISRDETGNAYSFAKSSLGGKLINTLAEYRNAERVMQKEMVPLIADILWDYTSEDTRSSVDRELAQLEKKLEFYKNKGYSEKRINNIQKRIDKIKPQQIGSKEDLIKLLQGDYDDLSTITSWIQSPSMMNNKIIQVYSNYLKSNLERARIQSISVINEGRELYEKYKSSKGFSSNNRVFNEKILHRSNYYQYNEDTKTWETVETYAFNSDFDWVKYNNSYVEMRNRVETLPNDKKNEAIARWFKDNTEAAERITVTHAGATEVIQKSYQDDIAEKKKYVENGFWSEQEYNYWYKQTFDDNGQPRVDSYQGRKLRQPKKSLYSSTNNMNAQDTEYHNYLMYTFVRAQKKRNKERSLQRAYHLPGMSKRNLDRLKEQGLKNWASKTAKGTYENIGSETEEIYGISNNVGTRIIPAYWDNIIDVEDQSTDAILAVLSYDKASRDYEIKAKMLPLSESLKQVVESNQPRKANLGKPVVDYMAKKLNLTTNAKYLKSEQNNIAKIIANMVDYHIYGEKKKSFQIGNVDANQAVNTMLKAMAFTSVGGPQAILTNVANILQGETQNAIEAASLKYFDKKTYTLAQAEYTKNLVNFAKDNSNPTAVTKIGQLVELYDPLIGRYNERYGKDMSFSRARKLTKTSNWFWLQNMGEHKIHVTSMIALMMSTKVKQNGKEISLYDAYEQKDGKLVLKDGVQLNNPEGILDMSTKIRMDHINQSNHGVYNDFDIPEMRRYAVGSLVEFFRKFVVSTMTKRYGALVATEASGEVTEGFYRTFFRTLFNETRELAKFSTGQDNNLTDMEKANLRRAYIEMMVVMSTGFLIMAMLSAYDDEDKEKTIIASSSIYLLSRLNSELSFYGGWGNPRTGIIFPAVNDIFRIAETPSLYFTYIKKLLRLFNQTVDDSMSLITTGDINRYERRYGWWDKGDSKWLARFTAILGATPGKLDPDEAVKVLELQRL